MDVKLDRREILPMMREHFPSLPESTSSDELAGFLDEMTGLTTAPSEANGSAFDRWRQALAQMHNLPVWDSTPEKAAAVKARGIELKALETARVAALPTLLAELKKEAPGEALKNP